MYKAIYKIQPDCLDSSNRTIFTPFINCYQIHSVSVYANGLVQEQEVDFVFSGCNTIWNEDYFRNDWAIVFDINYFYMKPNNVKVLSFLVNDAFTYESRTKEIISKHYIEGQFSLDNGLYKNAVLNFGTTLEALLNKDLSYANFEKLINSCKYSCKLEMLAIKDLRNRVHPNNILDSKDISRVEAVQARNYLEKILKIMKSEQL
jgi:hypothetical protein